MEAHAYRIALLITNNILYMILANCGRVEQICITIPLKEDYVCF